MDVSQAADGLNGMRRALDEQPDLVVLDFAAEDAPAVLRSRRALREAQIPLLVIAAGHVEGEEPGRRSDVSFMAAPASPERLAQEAHQIVESRRRARERAGNAHP